PDGRFVLFTSSANNLVTADGTHALALPLSRLNVYRRDRGSGTNELVSFNLAGTSGGNADAIGMGISTNGRYALFESSASDLVPGDTNNVADVFVRDLATGTTLRVSVSTNSGAADGESRDSVITPDGRFVAFVSSASNLVPADHNRVLDVCVRALWAGTTVRASSDAPDLMFSERISAEAPEITPDG